MLTSCSNIGFGCIAHWSRWCPFGSGHIHGRKTATDHSKKAKKVIAFGAHDSPYRKRHSHPRVEVKGVALVGSASLALRPIANVQSRSGHQAILARCCHSAITRKEFNGLQCLQKCTANIMKLNCEEGDKTPASGQAGI